MLRAALILLIINFNFLYAICCCSPGISCKIVNAQVQKSIIKAKNSLKENDKIFAKKISQMNQLITDINKLDKQILLIQNKINATEKVNNLFLNKIKKEYLLIKKLKLLIIKSLENLNNSISSNNKILLYQINLKKVDNVK